MLIRIIQRRKMKRMFHSSLASDFPVLIFTDVSGHCWIIFGQARTTNACHKKWGFTDNELCDCGEIQTVSHIVNSCSLTKFDGSLLLLHEADEPAIDWLTTYLCSCVLENWHHNWKLDCYGQYWQLPLQKYLIACLL